MNWTGPEDIRRQVLRLWERGVVLRSLLSEEPNFPKRLVLKTPSSRELTERFMDVRTWAEKLSQMKHVRLISRMVRHRVTGENTLPAEVWLGTAEEAAALIGKSRELRTFKSLVEHTLSRRPKLAGWLEKRPLVALEQAENWERILDLVDWLEESPRPACYLRQVDVPGVDTKFIESHRTLLNELFDTALPETVVEPGASGVLGFNRRYGFLDKPERVRLRILDPRTNPLPLDHASDITLDIESFAGLDSLPGNVFITENEINFLAFPQLADSCILFGSGYGISTLRKAKWLASRRLLYWGDIDTHGFAILDELRAQFPRVESLLMERETFLSFRPMWVREPSPCRHDLPHLSPAERELYDDLRSDRYGQALRLEQERVGYEWVLGSLVEKGFDVGRSAVC